jgi:hypothetical protein
MGYCRLPQPSLVQPPEDWREPDQCRLGSALLTVCLRLPEADWRS